METITYKGKQYPAFQSKGYAAQFAIPYAKHFCKGVGYDIGAGKHEWAFPGAIPVDIGMDSRYTALNLPNDEQVDYIFSSHCLEHILHWVGALTYWTESLKSGGVLFLYLPDYSQEYWRPWNNRKHLHVFTPQIITDWMNDNGYTNIFTSGIDLNRSFMVVGEKV